MERLRRSFRDSFRRRKGHVAESSKWQADEASVHSAGTCSFRVKYLGCVEVFESRGMQVCEEALRILRKSRRRPVKAVLYISGDGLRVVEDETKGLIVDQTIEKVSFCAPDGNHEKGFSYICRDGTTRRWMCHGFLALKESGERLSHAVGCAFAVCMERKQKRDKECRATMTFDTKNSTFARTGSFRQASITERLQHPQEQKQSVAEPPAVKPVVNPYARERPHATASMHQRQSSFRGFHQLNQTSPFKRQMSLRISELPSTLERQRSLGLRGSDVPLSPIHMKPSMFDATAEMNLIPEALPLSDKSGDSVSAMCQQLAQGLSLLSSSDGLLPPAPTSSQSTSAAIQLFPASKSVSVSSGNDVKVESLVVIKGSSTPWGCTTTIVNTTATTTSTITAVGVSNINTSSMSTSGLESKSSGGNWIRSSMPSSTVTVPAASWVSPPLTSRTSQVPPLACIASSIGIVGRGTPLPVVSDQQLDTVVNCRVESMSPSYIVGKAPPLSPHPHSLSSAEPFLSHHDANGQRKISHGVGDDPFDAEWADVAVRNQQQNHTPAPMHTSVAVKSTNPFISVKPFDIHM